MMNITGSMKVSDVAMYDARLRNALETLGIDICCGGQEALQTAAIGIGQTVEVVIEALQLAYAGPVPAVAAVLARDWRISTASELSQYIVRTHHAYLYSTLPTLKKLLTKVLKAHGKHHGKMLKQVISSFNLLHEDLVPHLRKEETILFPLICDLEQQASGGPRVVSPCGLVSNPIAQMVHEHEAAGGILRALREMTNEYEMQADFCTSFQALYESLENLEKDLHQHIFLENNILFLMAVKAEEAGCVQ